MNGIPLHIPEETLLSELPDTYHCKAYTPGRLREAKYAPGTYLHKLQAMMTKADGRFVVVVRKPGYGHEGGCPNSLLLGDDIITVLYPALMHMFKSMGKRFFKLIVRHAVDMDLKDGGTRVKQLQAICASVGVPFYMVDEKSKSNGQYQKIVFNQDFKPLWEDVLTKCAPQLIAAAGFDEDLSPSSTSGSSTAAAAAAAAAAAGAAAAGAGAAPNSGSRSSTGRTAGTAASASTSRSRTSSKAADTPAEETFLDTVSQVS